MGVGVAIDLINYKQEKNYYGQGICPVFSLPEHHNKEKLDRTVRQQINCAEVVVSR
jgi:hypothetical protein